MGTVRDLIVSGLRVFNEDGSLETTPEEELALLHKMMLECPCFSEAIAGGAVVFYQCLCGDDGQAVLDLAGEGQETGYPVHPLPVLRHNPRAA